MPLRFVYTFIIRSVHWIESGIIIRAWRLRMPIIMAAASFIALSEVSQIQELYVDFTGKAVHDALHILVFSISLAVLSFSLSASASIAKSVPGLVHHVEDRGDRLMQIGVSLAPLCGFQLGSQKYLQSKINYELLQYGLVLNKLKLKYPTLPDLSVFPDEISVHAITQALPLTQMRAQNWVVLILIVAATIPHLHRKIDCVFLGKSTTKRKTIFFASAIIVQSLFVIFSCAINIPKLSPTALAVVKAIGPFPLIVWFFALLTVHLTLFARISARRGYPFPLLILITCIFFTKLGLNENHEIRSTLIYPTIWIKHGRNSGIGTPTIDRLPFVEEAFAEWFANRPEREKQRFIDRPYPVYIVAAEGGGAYAAAQSAIFLARLYDQCPELVHHVFAISGVSGGSVGSAMLASLLQVPTLSSKNSDKLRCGSNDYVPQHRLEQLVKAMLKEDQLTPVLAVGLYPDLLQRFLPFPLAAFDRARAQEYALQQNWEKHVGASNNPFSNDFRSSWNVAGLAPLLSLNTTSVEQGVQKVIAPIESPRPTRDDHVVYFDSFFSTYSSSGSVPSAYDIPLSTAVGLSARFPGISPPGHHLDRDNPPPSHSSRSDSFVDGGYVDNSGVETADRILDALDWLLEKGFPGSADSRYKKITLPSQSVRLRLLVIGGESPETTLHIESQSSWETGFAAPVFALLNARQHRGMRAIASARELDPALLQVSIPWNFIRPPLGWKLSPGNVDLVGAAIGDASRCVKKDRNDLSEPSFSERANEVMGYPDLSSNEIGRMFEMYGVLNANHCAAAEIIEAIR